MNAREMIDQRLEAESKKAELVDCIQEIRTISNIRTLNEAKTKQSIILRILSLLDWDIHREIDPEHDVETGKGVETESVDYALQINGENEVLIEAKRPRENLENHQEQLLRYSFKKGVALAILTNGISWWFYLPLKKGNWDDRKFYTIDILEQDIKDIVDKFDLLLSRQNVASGESVQQAESILKNRQREKIVKERLPEAWDKVIKNAISPDSLLVDLLAETAEEVCGFKLESDEILGFIRSHYEKWLLSPTIKSGVSTPTKRRDTRPLRQTKKQTDTPKRMQIGSESYVLGPRQGYKILVNTANWLIDKGDLKPSDCPIKKIQGKSDLINQTGNGLETPRPLKKGLFIDTHGQIKKTVIPYAKKLLEDYGYDPEIQKIDY